MFVQGIFCFWSVIYIRKLHIMCARLFIQINSQLERLEQKWINFLLIRKFEELFLNDSIKIG